MSAAATDVTFLVTDIEGSTQLFRDLGEGFLALLARHNEIIAAAIERHGGRVLKTEGDAYIAVFDVPAGAITTAIESQIALAALDIRVRMGVHTGSVFPMGDDLIGLALNEAARISSCAHGGQIIVSDATVGLCERLPDGASVRDLGLHRLKDFPDGRRIYQVLHPGLDDAFPSLRTAAIERRVPAPATPLIGREDDADVILASLGSSRLVTLHGIGGVGKTRLAIDVGARAPADRFDLVLFVPLEHVSRAADVVPAIARAAGLLERPGHAPREVVLEKFGPCRTLLILDNVESVSDAGPAIADLLASAARLAVLATSRERLRIRGERVIEVEPLHVADGEGGAVELFLATARAAGVDVGRDARPAVSRICATLNGIPLAVELAASAVDRLTPEEIADRLDSDLEPPGPGYADLPERQQTLRATIGWSYRQMGEREQRAFRMLSVFAGGATLDGFRAVSGGVIDEAALGSLVDRSVATLGAAHGQPQRVRMLDTVRRAASEYLVAEGEADVVRRAHLAFVLRIAEAAERASTGPDQHSAFASIDAEHDNVLAALAFALEADAGSSADLAFSLHRYWDVRGLWTEGRTWLERALSVASEGRRAPLAMAAGYLALQQRDLDAARARLERAEELAREAGDTVTLAHALNQRAELERLTAGSDPERLLDEASALAESLDDRRLRALIANRRAVLSFARRDPDGALRSFLEAQEFARAAGDVRSEARALNNIGHVHSLGGHHREAREALERSLDAFKKLGDRQGTGDALTNLALVANDEADVPRAIALLEQGLEDYRTIGDLEGAAQALVNIGMFCHQTDPERGTRALLEAADVCERTGAAFMAGEIYWQVADWSADPGEYLDRAEAIFETLGEAEYLTAIRQRREASTPS